MSDFYILDPKAREVFELDDSPWSGLRLDLHQDSPRAFAEHVAALFEESRNSWARSLGHRIWHWCDARGWERLHLTEDSKWGEPEIYWPVTGTVFE